MERPQMQRDQQLMLQIIMSDWVFPKLEKKKKKMKKQVSTWLRQGHVRLRWLEKAQATSSPKVTGKKSQKYEIKPSSVRIMLNCQLVKN